MPLNDFLTLYKKTFAQHRALFFATTLLYFGAVGYYLFRPEIVRLVHATSQADELRKRVLDLEAQRAQQDQVIASFTARATQADFLKPLKFEEKWKDDHARETVGRLVEYAEFAITKNDFDHADRFYTEANNVQPTITIPYYQGRLAYRRGDLERTEAMWLEAIKRDSSNKYPDLRLYLGVLYYQLGRTTEARRYLQSFCGQGFGGGSSTF